MRTLIRTRIRPMAPDDIAQVADVERESFPSMWPQTAYRRELDNKAARYLVLTELREGESEPHEPPNSLWSAIRRIVGSSEPEVETEYLLGFIGVWLMVGEMHIVTVAVRDSHRRIGIGERLLIACLEMAADYDMEVVTLEVRKSNIAAQQLYEKYGFNRVGLRVRYYTDDHEDAVIMTTPDLASSGYRALADDLKAQHRQRSPDLW